MKTTEHELFLGLQLELELELRLRKPGTMQSLDSSCQEADFIINDTLKKLKGDNPLNASAHGLSHAVGSTAQQFVYQAAHNTQTSSQQSYHQLHTALQAVCSPTLAINNNQQQQQLSQPAPVTISFPTSSKSFLESSLLQAIPQIPAQPPICIFDDDESPTELPAGGNIVILSEQSHSTAAVGSGLAIAPSPSSCSSTTTTLSNFNSITSPSPVVPDLLLSTPPGVNSSFNSSSNNSNALHTFQQTHSSNNTNNSNRKADRRPTPSSSNTSSGSGSGNSHHLHHHHHLQQHQAQPHNHYALSSPTSSPSKRQKNSKDSSSSSRNTNLTRAGSGTGFNNASNSSTTSAPSSAHSKRETNTKFLNIHEKIKELYLQLLSNDLNHFAETGLKQRSRCFILDRLVECERLNTIVVNLYPGNKGYSLALHYDEQLVLNPLTNEWMTAEPAHAPGDHTNRSRPSADGKSRLADGDAAGGDLTAASMVSGFGLVEVLRWPYENDLLLQCIDRELLPEFLMDLLTADTVSLSSVQDGGEGSRVYAKPSVFYAGCVIVQIRDYRQTFATSMNICDMKHILLRPSNTTLFADVQQLGSTLGWAGSTPEDRLVLESQLVLATAEPLCLEPDPSIGRQAINAQHERQRFNSHEMRRQMKKFTQVAINRKRKLDQFTHHQGLELCDYLTRLRQRPRNASNSAANTTPATAPSNNPLVGAMLSSFTSKVPRRPHEVIRPIRPPCLEFPANLKVPENVINVEKYAKSFEPLNEFSDACKEGCQPNCRHNFQPQLIEEYVLETEREASEGRRALYHIKLSLYQRPSDAEFLGELYVDRDYREGERNGESCRFALGTRVHANRYIQQFREIFTEEGRKAVKITHLIPGHVPVVTHTGLTNEQRLLLQQQHQQQQQRQVQFTQQQQQLSATVHHVAPPHANAVLPRQQIVAKTVNSALNVQQTFRQQPQQTLATQFNVEAALQMQQQQQQTQLVNTNSSLLQQSGTQHQQQQQHIQLLTTSGSPSTTTTHQVSLSNGSLVLVQQQPQPQQQQLATTLQHSGITIQPANMQQQKTTNAQLNAAIGANSALRAQLNSNVPILQTQLKSAPIVNTQHQMLQQKQQQHQQQLTVNNNNSIISNNNNNNTAMHSNPAINAIVTSIMNSANQYQQQQQQQQHSGSTSNSNNNNSSSSINSNISGSINSVGTTLKNSNNASILNLLNSAPAAMTSTPVASGTFTTSSTSQQQTLTLVPHHQQQQQQSVPTTADAATATYVQTTRGTPTLVTTQRKQPSSEVLQNLLNTNRKINIVGAGGATTFRTNSTGNLIAVNINQSQAQQQANEAQTVRVSMSALASQLASPPAVMTNPTTSYGAYTVSTGGVCGSLKILNSGQQQQQRLLSSLRRDSTTAPPNAIVVGMAAPSPGSDSNASNASGFAVPTNLSAASGSGSGALNALVTNAATPSPSGSDHSQSSQTHQNQMLLDRLSNMTSNVSTVSAVAMPHMSPQQPGQAQSIQQQQQQQFITKTLVHSPATSSIHSPMSSPHPQPSASPQQQTTTTLNLQGINLSQLQGAMANFAGLQNVQVQIPGFTQPISLQFSGNSLQAPVQVQQQSQQQAPASSSAGTSASITQTQPQQRSVLVSVPVSQQQQLSHTITLQTQPPTQQQQHQHAPPTGTIVSLPSAVAGTQTVVITNSAAAGGGGTGGGGSTSGTGATTTMLTLPIAQLVGAGVQKINPQTIRTSSGAGVGVATAAGTAMQPRARNVQVLGTKQLASSRQLLTAQRQIGGSTLKISTPVNANAVNSSSNFSAGSIVMSTQKLQLKAVKAPGQQPQHQQQPQPQQQHRILNQSTATTASQTLPSPSQVQHHQVQHIQLPGRTVTTNAGVMSQRTLTALAAAKQQQQQAAVIRRRSTTDATK